MPEPRFADERGKGMVGCLFSALLFFAFSYAAYRIIPVYYNANEFQSATEREVERAGAKYIPDGVLRKSIMSLAATYQIRLEEKNLQIARSSAKLAVDVTYFVPVHFPMYTHTFRFKFRVTSIIGAL